MKNRIWIRFVKSGQLVVGGEHRREGCRQIHVIELNVLIRAPTLDGANALSIYDIDPLKLVLIEHWYVGLAAPAPQLFHPNISLLRSDLYVDAALHAEE